MRPAHLKERREKEVRALRKRQWEIFEESRLLGYKKLEKPIRHGWFKEVILTEKLERYSCHPEVKSIHEIVDSQIWGRNKKECDEKWRKRVAGNLIVKDLPTLSEHEFNKLTPIEQRLCVPYVYHLNRSYFTRFFLLFPRPSFQVKYIRAYVTHLKIIDPTLESELDLIDQKLLKSGYYQIDNNQTKNRWNHKSIYDEFYVEDVNEQLRGYRNKDLKTISWERNSKGKI
jgi:hypothetical protein